MEIPKFQDDKQIPAKVELAENYQLNTSHFYLFVKRSFDILGAVIGLICTSPLFLIITILSLFGEQGGPVFFKQERTGYNGKMFHIYKFRSMVVNSEKKLKSDKKLYKKYIENNYKLEPDEDPRITKVGRFLRKSSLDEIPQFINVLKGEMSLVGPRPVVKQELQEYGDKKSLLLSVKPGLTGYWQAYGRSNVGYPKRCNIELYYVDHQSILLDVKIMFTTIKSVILGKGAY